MLDFIKITNVPIPVPLLSGQTAAAEIRTYQAPVDDRKKQKSK